ncbi:metallophosphoesterase family protein [Isoptericola croceus]|uniref:metallophosphoesterase family protein n=1 Tax=Isoptericola croceus TaxID=3031406 RepID=UPI0023F656E3|nr:metallophosphoesterase family protein [Isoptericola croceus]
MSANVWFTSDVHFGHEYVARLRGFDTAAEHDEAVCDALHGHIGPKDTVWWLGDLATSAPGRALSFIGALEATHHLVAGNHDRVHPMHRKAHNHQRDYLEVFASVSAAARRRIDRREVLLSHFPYDTGDDQADHPAADGTPQVRHTQWRLPDEGRWLLHGHTHLADQVRHDHQIHVGWDAWSRPVHLDEIAELIRQGEQGGSAA